MSAGRGEQVIEDECYAVRFILHGVLLQLWQSFWHVGTEMTAAANLYLKLIKTKNLSLSMHVSGVFLCFLMLVSGHVLHANWFICLKPVVLKRPGIKKPQGKCSLKLQQAKLIWISSFFWYIPVDLQVSKIPLRSFLWLLLDANSEGQGMLQKTLKSTNKWLQLAEVIADS